MSIDKIYVITKDKYDHQQRTIGFIKDMGKHIYYDFLSHKVQLTTKKDGSHYSYHEDGSIWRTSAGIGKEQLTATVPLKKFNSYYNLCMTHFKKDIVTDLKAFKEGNRKKAFVIELDIENYESEHVNIVLDMIHVDFYDKFTLHPEASYPPNAEIFKRKLNNNIFIEITVLSKRDNQLIVAKDDGFTCNHYNKRFTANDQGATYNYEAGEKYSQDGNTKKPLP